MRGLDRGDQFVEEIGRVGCLRGATAPAAVQAVVGARLGEPRFSAGEAFAVELLEQPQEVRVVVFLERVVGVDSPQRGLPRQAFRVGVLVSAPPAVCLRSRSAITWQSSAAQTEPASSA